MILDLRGNPGGLLDQAIDVASEFLPRGQVVVSVKGRTEYSEPIVYKSTGSDPTTVPLVVLINRNSASASEIVAGAIQDHGRGLIVGETSFGKGLVQRIFQLPFNTGLTLTTARYYTPYGRSLQRDYSSGSLYDYYTRHDPTEKPAAQRQHNATQPRIATGAGFADAASTHWTRQCKPRSVECFMVVAESRRTSKLKNLPTRRCVCVSRKPRFTLRDIWQRDRSRVWNLTESRKFSTARMRRPIDFPITDRVVEAFRNFVRTQPDLQVQPAQIDEELEFAKMRLRQEIITAAFSNDAGARVLLDSDAQVLRALEALPDAKRLADNARNGVWQGSGEAQSMKAFHRSSTAITRD